MSRTTVVSSLVVGGLALVAFGAASDASTTPTKSQSVSPGSPSAFARCMRTHGAANFPDPQRGGLRIQVSQSNASGVSLRVNGVAVSPVAFKTAHFACQKYAPDGGPVPAAALAKLRAGALAVARCVRAHGVPNFPDPKVMAGPGGLGIRVHVGPGAGVDPNSPVFQRAQRACQSMPGVMVPKYAPAGAPLSAAELAKLRAGVLAVARCARAHGLPNFPDPQVMTDPGGLGVRVRIGPGVDQSSPAFQRAKRACQPLVQALVPTLSKGATTSAAR